MATRRSARKPGTTVARNQAQTPRSTAQPNTPGRTTDFDSTPLPDVEAEQSFAYGAPTTKPLPQQLVAHKRMTIQQIAETLDAGISQAEKNFQAQRREAEQYGMTTAAPAPNTSAAVEARALRAMRRSSSRDTRASSVESPQTPLPRRTTRGRQQSVQRLQGIREEQNARKKKLSSSAEEDEEAEDGGQEDEDVQSITTATSEIDTASHPDLNGVAESNNGLDSDPLPRPPRPPSTPAYSRLDQSSMPPIDKFDQTYSHERGLHVHAASTPPVAFQTRAWRRLAADFHSLIASCQRLVNEVRLLWRNQLASYFYNGSWLLLVVAAGLLLAMILSRVACDWYGETTWSYAPTRPWHHQGNKVCKMYAGKAFAADFNSSDGNDARSSATTAHVRRLVEEMRDQKQRVHELQIEQAVASSSIGELSAQTSVLMKQNDELQRDLKETKKNAQLGGSSQASQQGYSPITSSFPLLKRINYASPGLGAIVDPYMSSPTKTREFPWYQRLLLSRAGLKKYQSRPPIEALKPYSDVGDCWCAAAATPSSPSGSSPTLASDSSHTAVNGQLMDGKNGRYVQLAVILGTDIFPDEIVIEHLPLDVTPSPDSAPKDVEVWGDFSHLSASQFAKLVNTTVSPRQHPPHPNQNPSSSSSPSSFLLPKSELLGSTQLALLGTAHYDGPHANRQEGRFIQTFPLNVNQDGRDEVWISKVVLRVTTNWGAKHTCIYRVRVHGVPKGGRPIDGPGREEREGG